MLQTANTEWKILKKWNQILTPLKEWSETFIAYSFGEDGSYLSCFSQKFQSLCMFKQFCFPYSAIKCTTVHPVELLSHEVVTVQHRSVVFSSCGETMSVCNMLNIQYGKRSGLCLRSGLKTFYEFGDACFLELLVTTVNLSWLHVTVILKTCSIFRVMLFQIKKDHFILHTSFFHVFLLTL